MNSTRTGEMINTRGQVIRRTLMATLGLMIFGFGVHLTIQANIGVFPWDVFHLGLAKKLNILYGNVTIMVSLGIIVIDLLLKEKIGIGTFVDAVVVGKTVDFLNWLGWIKTMDNLWGGIVMMLVGLMIMGFAQAIYMRAGLCCGPKDTLLVALGKRMPPHFPIGGVSIGILLIVLLLGWLLDGPIGIGTLLSTVGTGLCMQFAFYLVKFAPLQVVHQDLLTSCKILLGKA